MAKSVPMTEFTNEYVSFRSAWSCSVYVFSDMKSRALSQAANHASVTLGSEDLAIQNEMSII